MSDSSENEDERRRPKKKKGRKPLATWRKAGLIIIGCSLLFAVWRGVGHDGAYYMCRPGSSDCKANQFGRFSSGFLCLQAAEAFCYTDRAHDRKTAYACVTDDVLMHTITCGEKAISTNGTYAGPVTYQTYAGRYYDEGEANRISRDLNDRR